MSGPNQPSVSVLQGASQYLVHERVGTGGVGVVHRGTLLTSAGERQVAVKRLAVAGGGGGEGGVSAGGPPPHGSEGRPGFRPTHPNLLPVLDPRRHPDGHL